MTGGKDKKDNKGGDNSKISKMKIKDIMTFYFN